MDHMVHPVPFFLTVGTIADMHGDGMKTKLELQEEKSHKEMSMKDISLWLF